MRLPWGKWSRGPAWAFLSFLIISTQAIGQESCSNCVDDDGDQAIDCYDRECAVDAGACPDTYLNREWPVPDCSSELELRVLWRGVLEHEIVQPKVGDTDGDTMPEVATIDPDRDTIRVLNGADGSIERQIVIDSDQHGFISLGDVDNDGTAELFVGNAPLNPGEYTLVRFEHDLSQRFSFANGGAGESTKYSEAALADFNHDGRPEVYMAGLIFDPDTGSPLVDIGDGLTLDKTSHTFAADVLPDEYCSLCEGLELIGSAAVYAVDVSTGDYELAASMGSHRGTFAVVDWDLDGELDIVTNVTQFGLRSWDRTGYLFVWDPRTETAISPTYTYPLHGSGSLPLVADVDGDFELEIVVVADREVLVDERWEEHVFVRVLDHDLTVLHEVLTQENSEWTSAAAFDFNCDSIPEIVHRGGNYLRIIDGKTGSVLAQEFCSSGTNSERAVVVDVNADGQADILAPCLGVDLGLVAWTVEGAPAPRQVMNQFQYYNVNVNDDLTIPCRQQDHANGVDRVFNSSLYQSPGFNEDGLSCASACPCEEEAVPVAAEVVPLCGSGSVVLDGAGSMACTNGRKFRWRDRTGAIVCNWSSDPTCATSLETSTTFGLDVSCVGFPGCIQSLDVEARVAERPAANAGDDARVCPGDTLALDGIGTGPGGCLEILYRWSDATGVLRDYDSDPVHVVTVGEDMRYTLDVLCVDVPGCESSDDVLVEIAGDRPEPAVGNVLRATGKSRDSVGFSWCAARPLEDKEHVHIYRSNLRNGPFSLVMPDPHVSTTSGCTWTDDAAPGALYYYDVRFASCTEEVSESPWRELP